MTTASKRYRGFISYSQKDRALARRLHRALEGYRVPAGLGAPPAPGLRLGRFFRDDDEMGASQSLGAALEGALDDAEALIVVCSPAAARSTWVDAEVRYFKERGGRQVYAVIASGQPHAADPERECFPPSLKVRFGPDGQSTGEADEPRAPDLQRDGMARVLAQLAAGLLGVPFDDLWQRDRRRARRRALTWGAAGSVGTGVLAAVGLGWLGAQSDARVQAAHQALAVARGEAAEGRVAEALGRLVPYLEHGDTQLLVEDPLRTLLGWAPDPRAQLAEDSLQAVRLRDATALLQPGQGVYDISDIGLDLERLIRSRDGRRIIGIGDQRVVVFDARNRERLAQLDNAQVRWIGHAFEAPSGLIVVTGAVLGPTNGSVRPYVLAVSADGRSVASHAIHAHMFWNSVAGVSAACDALLQATIDDSDLWHVEARMLDATGLSAPQSLGSARLAGDGDEAGVALLSRVGPAFATREAFMGDAPQNPFTAQACQMPGADQGAPAGDPDGTGVAVLDLGLTVEPASRWASQAAVADPAPTRTSLPDCTEDRPCAVVGGQVGETFARSSLPGSPDDESGWLPAGRWSKADAAEEPVFFEHLFFNSGHSLALCRQREEGAACLVKSASGEDHASLPLLRSPDGRFLYWPFGGVVVDLRTLQPLTAMRAIPSPRSAQYDFEADREGLTIAADGRLVSFLPSPDRAGWVRQDDERASARFGVLGARPGEPALLALASLGARNYLAVRADGLLARLDAARGEELWRVSAAGLGPLRDVQLDAERQRVLLIGAKAWRLFRLADGFAVSGLLVPPGSGATEGDGERERCEAAAALGTDGTVVARCGDDAWAWRPRRFEGDLVPTLARLTCAMDLGGSALETIRRCYAD